MTTTEPLVDPTRLARAAHERWPDLTDDQLREIGDDPQVLIGKLQAVYGLGREQARRAVEAFLAEHGLVRDDGEHTP